MIQDRENKLHLIDYTSVLGNKYAICGEVYTTKHIVSFFAIDEAIDNFCQVCYDQYTMFLDTDEFRSIKSSSGPLKKIEEKGTCKVEVNNEYWYLEYRDSSQIKRYQRQVTSRFKSRPKSKSKFSISRNSFFKFKKSK